jgi:glycosyltransferase involved in cell wall biosynthesis
MKVPSKEKIRILHCIETIASGGVEQTRLTLIRGLDNEQYENKIICTWAGGPVADTFRREGIELIPVGSFKHPFEWKKHFEVLKVIRDYKPHIIHGGVFEGMTMATFGGIFGRVPIVILEETSDPQNRSKKANLLLKIYSLFADKVQAISPEVGQYLSEITKIKKDKIAVITNGVPVPKFSHEEKIKQFKIQYGLDQGEFVVGFVGRLYNEHKRVTDLIDGVSYLDIPNLKLLIVGDGKDKGLIEDHIKNHSLEEKVIFAGYQSDPHPFYEMMDVLCVPSSREGFGLVAVEGMLHKLPVIATRVGGLQRVVTHYETGFIISANSPSEIAEKISTLFWDQDLKKAMGDRGYEKALKEYSSNRYVKEVEEMYQDLVLNQRSGFFK